METDKKVLFISLIESVKATKDIYQIIEVENIFLIPEKMQNRFISFSSDDTINILYKLMETLDTFDSVVFMVENLENGIKYFEFMRDQNPRKEIKILVYNDQFDLEIFDADGLEKNNLNLSEEIENIFDVVNSIKYIKNRT